MARTFDGVSDDIIVSDSTSLRTPSSALTIAAWHKVDTSAGDAWAGIFSKIVNGGADPFTSYSIQQDSSTQGVYWAGISDGSTSSLVQTASSTALTNGLWYAFVSRWASGGTLVLDIYNADLTLNQSVASASSSITLGYDTGNLQIMRNEASGYLAGGLAKLIIDDTEWTDGQVFTWLSGGPSKKISALDLQIVGATTEPDYSGNGNSGTVTGATVSDNPPVWTPFSSNDESYVVAVGGGVTIDLTAAALGFIAQATQSSLSSALTNSSLNFSSQSTQNSLVASLTTASLSFAANAVQAALSIPLTVSALTFTAQAIDTVINTIINLSVAALNFTTKAITVTGSKARQAVGRIWVGLGLGI